MGQRALVGTRYLADPALRAEYIREIAPRTGVALNKVLREVFPEGAAAGGAPRARTRRVLDLGAGTGAAGEAVRAYFREEVELVSVDQVASTPGVRAADVTNVPALARTAAIGSPFDLILAVHVLNELYLDDSSASRRAERIAELVGRWCQVLLADGGTLILVEPALRETSRALLAVRDLLLAAGLHVVAPCFFTGPCPALLRERDWCHDAAAPEAPSPRQPPRTPARATRATRVDFSYLVVRAVGEPPSDDATLFRIVSDPLPEKGRLKLFACGLPGRWPIVRLDRHAGEGNTDLDQLVRGDVARFARTTFAQDGLRVGKETAVTREVRPEVRRPRSSGDPGPA